MLRSRFFRVLVALLVLWSCALPALITDRNPGDFIRIALLYSTAGLNFFLGCSAIWLGCFAIDADVESAHLQLVAVKPVSRWTIYTAKFCAVAWINLILLAIASLTIFCVIKFRFSRGEYAAEVRARINNEILVGRRVYLPKHDDYNAAAKKIVEKKRAAAIAAGDAVNLNDDVYFQREAMQEAMSKDAEIRYNVLKKWEFQNLPTDLKGALVLRYRTFVGGLAGNKQRSTRLLWLAGLPRTEIAGAKEAVDFLPLSYDPEQVMGGVYTERRIPAEAITKEGTLPLGALNLDPKEEAIFMQPTDSPKVLIPVCGFGQNFFRMTLSSALLVLSLAAIGCAFASLLSLPTAVFCSFAYLFVGVLSQFWATQRSYPELTARIGYYVAKGVLFFVVPLQHFDATELVSNGELVEFSMLGNLFLFSVLLRTVPLFLLGGLIYRNRELAMAVRR